MINGSSGKTLFEREFANGKLTLLIWGVFNFSWTRPLVQYGLRLSLVSFFGWAG
jgi:hypothetical protein